MAPAENGGKSGRISGSEADLAAADAFAAGGGDKAKHQEGRKVEEGKKGGMGSALEIALAKGREDVERQRREQEHDDIYIDPLSRQRQKQDDGKPSDDKKADDKKPDDKKKSPIDEEFPDIDDNSISGSQGVKTAFKRVNGDRRALIKRLKEIEEKLAAAGDVDALKKEVEELKKRPAGAIEETEQFKALVADRDKHIEMIERLSYEQSPRFKEKYDNQIVKIGNQADSWLARIADPAKRASVKDAFTAAIIQTRPGMEADPEFYEKVEAILGMDGVPDSAKRGLDGLMVKARELINERADAIKDWRAKRTEDERAKAGEAESLLKSTINNLARVRGVFESRNAKAIEQRALLDEKYQIGYSDIVKTGMAGATAAIEKSLKGGVLSTELLELVHDGIEVPYLAKTTELMGKMLAEANKELNALKAEVARLKGGDPGDGDTAPRKKGSEEKGSGHAMVDALRKVREEADS